MVKKRIILMMLFILSFGILTSCSEDIEYIEYNVPNQDSRVIASNNIYFMPLKLGLRTKYEYSDSNDVELYYGTILELRTDIKNGFNVFEKYCDYNQIISFKILRKISISSNDDTYSRKEEKEVYSINVKLGDFLTSDEYDFNINNKYVDTIEMSLFDSNNDNRIVYINYRAIICASNDEYIKYLNALSYYDNETYESKIDESSLYNPLKHNEDYKNVKSITSSSYNLRVIFEDNKFKFVYPIIGNN